MIDELEWVKHQRPSVPPPTDRARLAAERKLQSAIRAEGVRPRSRLRRRVPPRLRFRPGPLASVAAVLVVVAVVAVFLGVHGHGPRTTAGPAGAELVLRAERAGGSRAPSDAAVSRAVAIIHGRIDAVDPRAGARVAVTKSGGEIVIRVGRQAGITVGQVTTLVETTGPLTFYDWEANALTPNGRPVASQLAAPSQTALQISQGGAAAPGSSGAGSMPLYDAVLLASHQPTQASPDNGRAGPEYFAFGAPGSAACSTAASYYSTQLARGAHCYLSGPTASEAQAIASLPPGVEGGVQVLAVGRGTVILEAVASSYARSPAWSSPTAQFYVLRDHVALRGSEIVAAHASSDQSGAPDIRFGFTPAGGAGFQRVTAEVAHRGALVSTVGQQLDQHFAVALNDELLTVPSIDFRTYPDGISSQSGADLVAGFTNASAHSAASQIRLGALPVELAVVSVANGR